MNYTAIDFMRLSNTHETNRSYQVTPPGVRTAGHDASRKAGDKFYFYHRVIRRKIRVRLLHLECSG